MRTKWYDLLDVLPDVLIGAEEDDDNDQSEEDDDGGKPDDKDKSSGAGSTDDKDKSKDDDDDDKGKESGAYKALVAERKARATAEKELKRLQKAKTDAELAEKTELEQTQIKLQAEETRRENLANALLNRDLNDAIRKAAQDLKFIDVEDALNGVNRTDLDYSQDDEDPADVTIDNKTVVAAVKALATRKPHFIQSGTDDGSPSGSGFGGTKQKKDDVEKSYREKYSSLN